MSIRTYFKQANEWLKKVQRSNEAKKKRWLIFLSGIGVLFVVLLWLVYMNISIPALGKPSTTFFGKVVLDKPAETQVVVKKQESFFEVLGKGFEVLGKNIKEQIAKTKERINTSNEFSIEGEERNTMEIQ